MNDHELPTWNAMVLNTQESLDAVHHAASDARDWITSDWRPIGSSLTDQAADARTEVLRIVGQIKALADQGKNALHRAQNGTGTRR